MARDSCTTLNQIVDDILDVARSEHGSMPVHFTPISLDLLAEEIVGRYRPAAGAKSIELRLLSDHRDIRIVGDPERLTQVLNNLLSNAIKFTPAMGLIEVEVFGPSVASSHVGVSVSNNGEPIPEEARERVFEKFEQVKDSSTRRVGGTGLGLAISRAIIEAHGGRIWVDSGDDGTKFIFTLPSAPDAADLPAEAAGEFDLSPQTAPVAAGVVLLLDCDRHSSYILKGILMAAGHEVLLAEDADSALTQARARQPSLIVIRDSQELVDAFDLVEILKHDPDTRKATVLMLSSTRAREDAIRVGADEFLPLPIDSGGVPRQVPASHLRCGQRSVPPGPGGRR